MLLSRPLPVLALAAPLAPAAHAAEMPGRHCLRAGMDDALRPIPASLVPAARHLFGHDAPDTVLRYTSVFRKDRAALLCNVGANLLCGAAVEEDGMTMLNSHHIEHSCARTGREVPTAAHLGGGKRSCLLLAASVAAGAAVAPAQAQPNPVPREVPARLLPVPGTVSPGMRHMIAAPLPPGWDTIPQTPEAWRQLAAQSAAEVAPHLPRLKAFLGVTVEAGTIAGIRVFVVTPNELPPENRGRLLLHLHGGGYVLYPGEAGAGEAMLMAGFGRFKVISVDYRMPPNAPFPAALDDALTVWRAMLGMAAPRHMAAFGSSAGGGLTLALMLRARQEGLPLPAAIAPGTPWSDMAGEGDSYAANEFVDNVLVSNQGWVGAAARLYAGAHDLREPLLSPIHGDLHGFPPAILTTGTRDLFLSNTIRTHRKLRQAGVVAALQVFEGQSHAQYLADPYAPEAREVFEEIARFFDAHLER